MLLKARNQLFYSYIDFWHLTNSLVIWGLFDKWYEEMSTYDHLMCLKLSTATVDLIHVKQRARLLLETSHYFLWQVHSAPQWTTVN